MGKKILVMDGVKYEEWMPQGLQPEGEFEREVKKHTQEIFGEQSIYIDRKQMLKSISGIGSKPDGFAIVLGPSPQWHIVEMELSSHDVYGHIVPQVTKFMTGIDNSSTRNDVREAIYDEVTKDYLLNLRLTNSIGTTDRHKFLSDLISNPPILTIIIEAAIKALEDVKKTLAFLQIKIVEFQTFVREGVGLAVHAHLFEPLYMPVISIKPEIVPLQPPENSLEVTLQPSYLESYCIYIPAAKKHLFPAFNTTLKLDSDIGPIETGFSINSWGIWLSKGLVKWFKAHPELKAGDKLLIAVIEPMKRYRLELLK